MTGLVISRNSHIDEFEGRVGVAEGNHGNVDVGSLTDGLVVYAGVGDDDETGFLERTGNVVGETTGGETTSNSLGASVGGVFEDGTVAVGTSGNDTNIVRVFNGSDNPGSENEFLPGLANVDNVETCRKEGRTIVKQNLIIKEKT